MSTTTLTSRATTNRPRWWLRSDGADRSRYVLASIVALAMLIRLATLGVKSYWHDEGLTVQLLHLSFGRMLHALHASEPNPPLYFAVAWVWARVFGYGEFALRSLSAIAGVLTIPLTYVAARRLVGRRGALMTAALLAVNPMLVWYSQDARAYALFLLLAAGSLVFLVRALERPDPTVVLAWGVTCGLMLATHYFAIFLIASEAAWVMWSARGRVAVPLLTGIAALPLIGIAVALSESQSATGISWGGPSTLASRVIALPGALLVGFEAPQRKMYAVVSALLALVALAVLARRASPSQLRGAAIAASIGMAILALPTAAALLGHDYITPRNVIVAILPLSIVIGTGVSVTVPATARALTAGALLGIAATAVLSTAWTPKYRYQDWRNVAAAMGRPARARAVVLDPAFGSPALAVYLRGGLRPLSESSPAVSEIDVVATIALRDGWTSDPLPPAPGGSPKPPAAGFALVNIERRRRFTLVRYAAHSPQRVTSGISRAADFAGPGALVLIEPAGR